MASVVGEREVDLSKLSLEQLNQLKTQLTEEVEEVTRHFATLRDANSRLNTCRNTVTELASQSEGTEILVPLTQSLYVPGKVKEADKVLIDIGTGYFVEKTLPQAKDYIDKKISVVSQNTDSVKQVLEQKEQALQMVSAFFQRRLAMMSQAAQQGRKP